MLGPFFSTANKQQKKIKEWAMLTVEPDNQTIETGTIVLMCGG